MTSVVWVHIQLFLESLRILNNICKKEFALVVGLISAITYPWMCHTIGTYIFSIRIHFAAGSL